MSKSYYPLTNDGRANFWDNVLANAGVLSTVGFIPAEITAVENDATWGVFVYRTLRQSFEETHQAVIAYCDAVADLPDPTPLPPPPVVPAFPTPPGATVDCGFETRRERWVRKAKSASTYTAVIGAQLGIEAGGTPFDPATYQAELSGMTSPSAHTVTGKFRKAGGNIDGINLYGRKDGTMAWTPLGRFNATPLSALVPLAAGSGPEAWEFLARAVKRDAEIGVPSDVVQQIVRG